MCRRRVTSLSVRFLARRVYLGLAVVLESARLMRIGPDEIAKNRDGIALMGSMVRVLTTVGMFARFEVPVRGSTNYKQTIKVWAQYETCSGYYWIGSRTNTRSTQLDSRRAYVRAQLHATALGIDMHPLSQALQEFAEVSQQYDALKTLSSKEAPARLRARGRGATARCPPLGAATSTGTSFAHAGEDIVFVLLRRVALVAGSGRLVADCALSG